LLLTDYLARYMGRVFRERKERREGGTRSKTGTKGREGWNEDGEGL